MKITILAVGRVKEAEMRMLVDQYLSRVRRHFPIEEIEIPDGPEKKLAQVMLVKAKGATRIALEAHGKEHESRVFAAELARLGSSGKGDLCFLIGGKAGLPEELVKSSSAVWSLSKLTFPHRLARLVLAEQLYRATTILRGEPYANET